MKNLQPLFLKSKTGERLDTRKICQIARLLNRSELRQYLLFLKRERNREKATVETPLAPFLLGPEFISFLKKKFKNKEIEFIKNKELIAGLKIRIDEKVLDLSFKGAFGKLYGEDR